MKIILNGDPVEISDNSTIQQLLIQKKIDTAAVVAELNGQIAGDYNIALKDNDRLEIIRMVGGG